MTNLKIRFSYFNNRGKQHDKSGPLGMDLMKRGDCMSEKKNKLIAEMKNHSKKYGFPVKKKAGIQHEKKGKK